MPMTLPTLSVKRAWKPMLPPISVFGLCSPLATRSNVGRHCADTNLNEEKLGSTYHCVLAAWFFTFSNVALYSSTQNVGSGGSTSLPSLPSLVAS